LTQCSLRTLLALIDTDTCAGNSSMVNWGEKMKVTNCRHMLIAPVGR
jgi:hypothetical protein